jgi:hypothetical protein
LVVSGVFAAESFESDHFAGGIFPQEKSAVASDGFNGTVLTPFSFLYEYALSFLFSLDHDCRLLVDACLGPKPPQHHTAIAFSDHE